MPLHENPELKRESFESLLMAELVGLGTTMCAAMDANPGFVPCSHAFDVLLEGLEAAAVPASLEILREQAGKVHAHSEHIAEHRGVPRGAVTCLYAGPGREPIADAVSSVKMAACAIEDSGCENEEACVAIARALATRLAAASGYHLRQRQGSPRAVVISAVKTGLVATVGHSSR